MNNNIINFKESIERLKEKKKKNTYFVDVIDVERHVIVVQALSKEEAEDIARLEYKQQLIKYDEPDREYVEFVVQQL
jgi:hypothetical protein|tara:strand:+ start:406 stop:636 length:231 start_codon:yes stop_codon:yes gene_type:complete